MGELNHGGTDHSGTQQKKTEIQHLKLHMQPMTGIKFVFCTYVFMEVFFLHAMFSTVTSQHFYLEAILTSLFLQRDMCSSATLPHHIKLAVFCLFQKGMVMLHNHMLVHSSVCQAHKDQQEAANYMFFTSLGGKIWLKTAFRVNNPLKIPPADENITSLQWREES